MNKSLMRWYIIALRYHWLRLRSGRHNALMAIGQIQQAAALTFTPTECRVLVLVGSGALRAMPELNGQEGEP